MTQKYWLKKTIGVEESDTGNLPSVRNVFVPEWQSRHGKEWVLEGSLNNWQVCIYRSLLNTFYVNILKKPRYFPWKDNISVFDFIIISYSTMSFLTRLCKIKRSVFVKTIPVTSYNRSAEKYWPVLPFSRVDSKDPLKDLLFPP